MDSKFSLEAVFYQHRTFIRE